MAFTDQEILETVRMVELETLDIRTTTLGINLLDCADPDLGPLMQRLTSALGIAPGQLADQGGQILDARMLEDLYSGPGCTPVFAPGEPPLKIHVVDRRGEPHFLVRVWELGEIAP